MRRRTGSLVEAWAWGTIILLGTRMTTTVGATCLLSSMSIETTNGGLAISGCYRETVYLGLYQTIVWTLEGSDIADSGTAAIVADLGGSVNTDPVWTIGTVVSNPTNTWSDGYSAGLVVEGTACIGGSPFWETADPTAETLWKCDSNGDGTVSVAEAGDFTSITCGCIDENGLLETPSPTPSVTSSVGITTPTTEPAAPTPGASSAEATLPPVPIINQPVPGTSETPAPSSGAILDPAALACNITLTSETLHDVSGCYAGRVSSTSRGSWVQLDESSWIDWQEADGNDPGYWAIVLNGFGVADTEKCFSFVDESNPTDIPDGKWFCDFNGDGEHAAAESGDFTELECSSVCLSATAAGTASDGSSSGVSSKTVIIAGSIVGAVVLVGLFAVALILLIRRKKRVDTKEPVEGETATEPVPPPPVPVFEPWGSRPPPRFFGSS